MDITNILCDQVIDVALVNKEAKEFINNGIARGLLTDYPTHFVERIDSVQRYVYCMFMESNANKLEEDRMNTLFIELLATLVKYRNSYYPNAHAYKVMNSLLDIVKTTFVELN